MNYKKISSETYRKFADKQGNDHIVGDYALEEILRIIEKFNCKNILEVGLGIGSISDAILNFSESNSLNINYSGTEANEYCLKQLPQNVDRFKQIKLYSEIAEIAEIADGILFDLIIVDGSDTLLSEVKKLCAKNALIFIEGGRASQIKLLNEIFPKFYQCEIISIRKPPAYGPFHQKWTGGGTLIAINPTIFQKVFIFTEKVKTFSKRRVRKYTKG